MPPSGEWTAIVLDVDGQALAAALRSIYEQSRPASTIIVVDNGSMVPVSTRIDSKDRVQILRFETNRGFTGGVNAAFELVRTDYAALINNDVVLDPTWAESLIRTLEQSGAAAAQGVLLREDGRVDGAGICFDEGRIGQLGHLQRLDAVDFSRFAGVSATAVIYHAETLRKVAVEGKILHPKFFAYYEDVELAARLLDAGFAMKLDPRPMGTHSGSASAAILGRESLRMRVRNRYYVARLHPGRVSLTALFAEDLKRVASAAMRGRWLEAVDLSTGMIRGLA